MELIMVKDQMPLYIPLNHIKEWLNKWCRKPRGIFSIYFTTTNLIFFEHM